jgi:putative lipoprotein
MKKIINYMLLASSVAAVSLSCSKWTEPEPLMPTDRTANIKSEAELEVHYANIRAYRESDHPVMMGYYQGWSGVSQDYRTSLMGLPDSLDIISMWGAGFNYTEAQKADLKEAQEKKGLKCLLVFIAHSIGTQITPSWIYNASEETPVRVRNRYTGEYETFTDALKARRAFWGMDPDDGLDNTPEMDAMAVKAAELYADSLCHIINNVLHLDGFDWDMEYGWSVGDNVGDLIGDQGTITTESAHDRTLAFVKRMREGLGDKTLIIDGEPARLPAKEACVYFDYFANQVYCTNSSNAHKRSDEYLDSYLQGVVDAFSPYLEPEFVASRFIALESTEWEWNKGGVAWQDRWGTQGLLSWEGVARWTPFINGEYMRKGGMGAYLINNDYSPVGAVTYPRIRRAIQVMNPAVE